MESNNDDDFILRKKFFLPALFSQNKFHYSPLRKYISQTINLILFSCQEIMSFNNEYFTRNVDLSYFLQYKNYMALLFKSKLQYKTLLFFHKPRAFNSSFSTSCRKKIVLCTYTNI